MRVLYDLVIVGGGAAGLTAALYASRSGLDCIVLDPSSPEGSSIALTDAVENYTGFSDIAGFDLIQHFYSHAKSFGANFVRQSLVGIRKIMTVLSLNVPTARSRQNLLFSAWAQPTKNWKLTVKISLKAEE